MTISKDFGCHVSGKWHLEIRLLLNVLSRTGQWIIPCKGSEVPVRQSNSALDDWGNFLGMESEVLRGLRV